MPCLRAATHRQASAPQRFCKSLKIGVYEYEADDTCLRRKARCGRQAKVVPPDSENKGFSWLMRAKPATLTPTLPQREREGKQLVFYRCCQAVRHTRAGLRPGRGSEVKMRFAAPCRGRNPFH